MNSNLKLIASDASDKKFYRHLSPDGESLAVCMKFSKWEGGFGGDPFSWLKMHSALTAMQIPVPEVYKIDEKECTIWLEDLGGEFLSSNLKTGVLDILDPDCKKVIDSYKEALNLLVQVQYAQNSTEHPAHSKLFDFQKLYDEMLFFIEHFLNGFLRLNISPESHPGLFKNLETLCQRLNDCERVFCHRDYHGRNLMVKNNKIYWIDFQDARMGPHSYDVVSLLRDSYIDITWKTRADLFQHYFEALNKKRNELKLSSFTAERFYSETLLMGLQRNLKAIGSFGYLAAQKKKINYLDYISHTLNTICAKEATSSKNSNLDLIKIFPNVFHLIFDLQSGPSNKILLQKIETIKKEHAQNESK